MRRRNLLLALFLMPAACGLAPPAHAESPDRWVPVRWQGGPLELHRLRGSGLTLDADTARNLNEWYRQSTLDLLKDTQINCVLVTWSTGAARAVEREQQRLIAGYTARAHAAGIAVLGIVYPGSQPAASLAAGRRAGLDGLVLEGAFPPDWDRHARGYPGLPLIRLGPRTTATLIGNSPVYGTVEGSMPRVRTLSSSDAVVATPTSEPWIDSNTWLVRLLTERHRLPVWLGFSLDHPSPDDYVRAVADTAAAGGRWVIAPDLGLMAGLARGDPGATRVWRRISETVRFFEEQDGWRRFECRGPLGVVYEPEDPDGAVFAEYLNLIARRRIPYRLIARPALRASTLDGLRAVLATALNPPSPEERNLLESFAVQGGLVIAGSLWSGAAPASDPYEIRRTGTGRLVVYRSTEPDPESLSKDLLSLLGRGNLGLRVFNASSVLCTAGAADSGRRLLVQLINYASMPSEAVTVRIAGRYRKARLYRPGRRPEDLPLEAAEDSVQVAIKEVSVYAALLLEK